MTPEARERKRVANAKRYAENRDAINAKRSEARAKNADAINAENRRKYRERRIRQALPVRTHERERGRKAGHLHYFSGECVRGHPGVRYVSNSTCVYCSAERMKARRQSKRMSKSKIRRGGIST